MPAAAMVKCVPCGFQAVEMCQPQTPVTITEVILQYCIGVLTGLCLSSIYLQSPNGSYVLENKYLKAVLENGTLTSLIHKELGRYRLI